MQQSIDVQEWAAQGPAAFKRMKRCTKYRENPLVQYKVESMPVVFLPHRIDRGLSQLIGVPE